jgi:hypothetical protein
MKGRADDRPFIARAHLRFTDSVHRKTEASHVEVEGRNAERNPKCHMQHVVNGRVLKVFIVSKDGTDTPYDWTTKGQT